MSILVVLLTSLVPQVPDHDGVRMNGELIGSGDVATSFQVTSDQRWLVYRANAEVDNDFEIFRVPLDRPGEARRVSAVEDGMVTRFALVPGSTSLVYDDFYRIFQAPLDLGQRVLLADFGTRGVSAQLFPSPDGTRLLFTGSVHNGRSELCSVPMDGSQPFVSLSGPMVAGVFPLVGGNAGSPLFAGSHAIYNADQEIDEQFNTYSVPLDGSAPKVRLNPLPIAGGDVLARQLSPDGSRVVLFGDFQVDEEFELWSAPADGSSPAVQLNAPLVTGGDVHIAFSIVGDQVLYRADQEVDGKMELYRVALDGSSAAVKLSHELPGGSGLSLLQSGDSHAVYLLAAPLAGEQLFAVPLDASSAPVVLNGPLVAGGSVQSALLSPDGSRVVYWADQASDQVVELWSAPIDGSSAAVRLNGALVSAGDVLVTALEHRQFSADGRMIYRADADTDGKIELWFVPVDGSAAPVKLNPPLVAGGNVQDDPELAPDGKHVVFRADAFTDERFVLLSASLEPTPRIDVESGTLVAGGDVASFLVPSANRILYRADQLQDGKLELFQSRFRRPNWRP